MSKLLTFLEAEVPLTKTFSKDEVGQIVKVGHPGIFNCQSHTHDVADIQAMLNNTLRHAALGHCLLKGPISRELKWESRAGTTSNTEPTWWICLDLDGHRRAKTPQDFMDTMKMGDVDRIDQYSSSMGVLPDKGLSAHVLVMLDRPMMPDQLKQWLIAMNLAIPELRTSIALTRTGNALRWPLDITTCQNDKLIYIAPPLLKDGVEDGFQGDRIQLVTGTKRVATLDMSKVNAEANRIEMQKIIDQLRDAAGLEKKKHDRTKMFAGVEYMPNPDKSIVTGVKEDRGFIYLNLNGGDSWGYYHPKDNPEFVRNFKGEPAYRTSELAPDYWAAVRRAGRKELLAGDEDTVLLAFRDFYTATYYNGTYCGKDNRLDLAKAQSSSQLRDFWLSRGQPVPDAVADFDLKFDPHSPKLVDFEAKPRPTVNRYQCSEFERRWLALPKDEQAKLGEQVPASIHDVLMHVLVDDETFYDYQLNWFATIAQLKVNTGVAVVWQGIQGTGKGMMFTDVLMPIIGSGARRQDMSALATQFNGWLDGVQLVWVDEVDMSAMGMNKGMMEANLKKYITENDLEVMNKHSMSRSIKSYANFIFPSNKEAPVTIDPSDRRFVVAPFQQAKIKMTTAWADAVKEDAWKFYGFLMKYKADRERAREPINTAAKETAVNTTMSSHDHVARALKEGNLLYFIDQIPDPVPEAYTNREVQAAREYKQLVEVMKNYSGLKREELFVLFNFVVGGLSSAPGKFGQLLAHRGIEMKSIRRDDKVVKGFPIKWRI